MRRDIYHDPQIASDDWIDYLFERINRPGGHDAIVATTRFLAESTAIMRSVRAVRAPTLIVWGEHDRLFPASNGHRLLSDVAGSRLEIIPACGHSPPEERPRELLRLLQPFLRGESAAADPLSLV
jgi:pimeloyl-ACP methyl ester carboxylesterase